MRTSTHLQTIRDDHDGESSPRAVHRSTDESLYRLGVWTRAALFGDDQARAQCRQLKIPMTRAAGENVNEAGGFRVEPELETLILEARAASGTYRRAVDVKTMNSDVRKIAQRGAGVTVFFSGEAQAITETNVIFHGVEQRAKKVTGILIASSELINDSPIDIGAFLAEEFGSAIAGLQDTVGWVGDGTSAHGGMRGIAAQIVDGTHTKSAIDAASGHNTALTIDAVDIGAMIGALPERFLSTATFYASSYFIGNAFARLGATSAGIVRTAAGPRPLMHFAGIPIEPVKELPGAGTHTGAAMILLGDARFAATLGERRGLRLARTESRYLERDQIAFRVTTRFSCVAHTLGDDTAAGPVVALVGKA